jgi:hypothetical protein
MVYTRKELTAEINEAIESLLAKGSTVVVAWLVQLILKNHPDEAATDFSQCARYEFVNDEVGRCVRKFKEPEPDELAQLTLPGFKRLQKAYRITRDDDQIIVPIEAMTDDELLAKAEEHDLMSKGHRTHAREIRRYVSQRNKARKAS